MNIKIYTPSQLKKEIESDKNTLLAASLSALRVFPETQIPGIFNSTTQLITHIEHLLIASQ